MVFLLCACYSNAMTPATRINEGTETNTRIPSRTVTKTPTRYPRRTLPPTNTITPTLNRTALFTLKNIDGLLLSPNDTELLNYSYTSSFFKKERNSTQEIGIPIQKDLCEIQCAVIYWEDETTISLFLFTSDESAQKGLDRLRNKSKVGTILLDSEMLAPLTNEILHGHIGWVINESLSANYYKQTIATTNGPILIYITRIFGCLDVCEELWPDTIEYMVKVQMSKINRLARLIN